MQLALLAFATVTVLAANSPFEQHMDQAQEEFHRGRYREAWASLRAAEPAAATRPEMRAQFLNARSALLLVEGKLTAAQRDIVEVVRLAEHFGDPHLQAGALHNLASLEAQTGELARAQEHQEHALARWSRLHGPRHEFVRRALISLSSIQGLRQDWHAAARSLESALAIAESPDALGNYAVILDRLHRKKEAKEVRRRLPALAVSNALVDLKTLRREAADHPRVVVR